MQNRHDLLIDIKLKGGIPNSPTKKKFIMNSSIKTRQNFFIRCNAMFHNDRENQEKQQNLDINIDISLDPFNERFLSFKDYFEQRNLPDMSPTINEQFQNANIRQLGNKASLKRVLDGNTHQSIQDIIHDENWIQAANVDYQQWVRPSELTSKRRKSHDFLTYAKQVIVPSRSIFISNVTIKKRQTDKTKDYLQYRHSNYLNQYQLSEYPNPQGTLAIQKIEEEVIPDQKKKKNKGKFKVLKYSHSKSIKEVEKTEVWRKVKLFMFTLLYQKRQVNNKVNQQELCFVIRDEEERNKFANAQTAMVASENYYNEILEDVEESYKRVFNFQSKKFQYNEMISFIKQQVKDFRLFVNQFVINNYNWSIKYPYIIREKLRELCDQIYKNTVNLFKSKYNEANEFTQNQQENQTIDMMRSCQFIDNLKIFNNNIDTTLALKDKTLSPSKSKHKNDKEYHREKYFAHQRFLKAEKSKLFYKSLMQDKEQNFQVNDVGCSSKMKDLAELLLNFKKKNLLSKSMKAITDNSSPDNLDKKDGLNDNTISLILNIDEPIDDTFKRDDEQVVDEEKKREHKSQNEFLQSSKVEEEKNQKKYISYKLGKISHNKYKNIKENKKILEVDPSLQQPKHRVNNFNQSFINSSNYSVSNKSKEKLENLKMNVQKPNRNYNYYEHIVVKTQQQREKNNNNADNNNQSIANMKKSKNNQSLPCIIEKTNHKNKKKEKFSGVSKIIKEINTNQMTNDEISISIQNEPPELIKDKVKMNVQVQKDYLSRINKNIIRFKQNASNAKLSRYSSSNNLTYSKNNSQSLSRIGSSKTINQKLEKFKSNNSEIIEKNISREGSNVSNDNSSKNSSKFRNRKFKSNFSIGNICGLGKTDSVPENEKLSDPIEPSNKKITNNTQTDDFEDNESNNLDQIPSNNAIDCLKLF